MGARDIKPHRIKSLGAALLALVLCGCQTAPSRWNDPVDEEIRKNLVDAHTAGTVAATTPSVPSEISQALLPPLRMTLPDGDVVPLEPRFDLSANETPA